MFSVILEAAADQASQSLTARSAGEEVSGERVETASRKLSDLAISSWSRVRRPCRRHQWRLDTKFSYVIIFFKICAWRFFSVASLCKRSSTAVFWPICTYAVLPCFSFDSFAVCISLANRVLENRWCTFLNCLKSLCFSSWFCFRPSNEAWLVHGSLCLILSFNACSTRIFAKCDMPDVGFNVQQSNLQALTWRHQFFTVAIRDMWHGSVWCMLFTHMV